MSPARCFGAWSRSPGGSRSPCLCGSRPGTSPREEQSPWPPQPAATCARDLSLSSVTNEDENAVQQCRPRETFPCENWDGSLNMSPSGNECVSTKRARSPSLVKLEIRLGDADDECDLVIDESPPAVNKKPRRSRNCTEGNRHEELSAVMCAGEFCDSAIADNPECTEEESEEIVVFNENRSLTKREKIGSVSPKANAICLPYSYTDILNIFGEGDSLPRSEAECVPLSASIQADTEKRILKEGNAENGTLAEAFVQKHTKEDCVSSGRVTQSIFCAGCSSKDETTVESPYKEIITKADSSQSTEEKKSNDTPEDTHPYPTYYLNKDESEITLQNASAQEEEPSAEDTEFSESDDTLEECRRIFDEYERETRKKACDKQVSSKTEKVPSKASPWQQCHGAEIPQIHWTLTVALGRGQVFIPIAPDRGGTMSRLPATQILTIGPVASLNLVQVQPVAEGCWQLPTLQPVVVQKGNAAAAVRSEPLSGSSKSTAQVTQKISTWRKPSTTDSGCKVPPETRERYVTLFFTECLKNCRTANEAFDQALTEEQSVYDRCGSKKMYLNFAVNTLKKLRHHGQHNNNGTGSLKSEEDTAFTGHALYELLKDYLLTEEQLNENNFPRPNPEENGSAILPGVLQNTGGNAFKRMCCRCGEVYDVTASGEHRRKEECNYHSGRVLKQKVNFVANLDKKYYIFSPESVREINRLAVQLHVHDGRREKLEGFVKTYVKSAPSDGDYRVYALNCEMCYTTNGLEATRVTVVDAKLQVVYDTLVKPDGKVVDYDRRLSGVTEDDLKTTTTSLQSVQAILLNLFSADTVLIGHNLEKDLFALKLIHDTVVDTSVVFPHRLGLPHKRTLKSLMAEYFMRIHHDDVEGHDSKDNSIACMELILWKVKEDNKRRKR